MEYMLMFYLFIWYKYTLYFIFCIISKNHSICLFFLSSIPSRNYMSESWDTRNLKWSRSWIITVPVIYTVPEEKIYKQTGQNGFKT